MQTDIQGDCMKTELMTLTQAKEASHSHQIDVGESRGEGRETDRTLRPSVGLACHTVTSHWQLPTPKAPEFVPCRMAP